MSLPPTTRRSYTLMNIFNAPANNCSRDFVRENKRNIRELEKQNTKTVKIKNKHFLTGTTKTGAAVADMEAKKSASSQRTILSTPRDQHHQTQTSSRHLATTQQQQQQQRIDGSRKQRDTMNFHHNNNIINNNNNNNNNSSPHSVQRNGYNKSSKNLDKIETNLAKAPAKGKQRLDNRSDKSNTNIAENSKMAPRKIVRKAQSIDKSIQTEDIKDEEFLYQALHKCASIDKFNTNENYSTHGQHGDSVILREDLQDTAEGTTGLAPADNMNLNLHDLNLAEGSILNTERSKISMLPTAGTVDEDAISGNRIGMIDGSNSVQNLKSAGSHHSLASMKSNVGPADHHLKHDLPSKTYEVPPSSENNYNNHESKKYQDQLSPRSVRALGDRQDIRLPRYLEREKREKEERDRQPPPDPHCPPGHYLLSNEERLVDLDLAKKRENELIKRLNSMSITSNTLRVRRAKIEVENELTDIEATIRVLSKPKVYKPLSVS